REAARARRDRRQRRGSGEHSMEERDADLSEECIPSVIPSRFVASLLRVNSTRDPLLIDCNTLIGPYPFRHVPHPDPEILERVVKRDGLDGAWVGHLPSAFHRDPSAGNEALFTALEKTPSLKPVPTIRPDWPKWNESLVQAKAKGAVAIRAYPS